VVSHRLTPELQHGLRFILLYTFKLIPPTKWKAVRIPAPCCRGTQSILGVRGSAVPGVRFVKKLLAGIECKNLRMKIADQNGK
jgi:hypothetical protein